MWSVTVHGTPAPKGSLICRGRNGRHAMAESDRQGTGKPWRKLLGIAGRQMLAQVGEQLTGPLSVECTVTLARPATVKPRDRPWPHLRSILHGDVDKLARMILDGLEDSELFANDAQVCVLHARKVYPDTPVAAYEDPMVWHTFPLASAGAMLIVRPLTPTQEGLPL